MSARTRAGIAVALLLLGALPHAGHAASFDCNANGLSASELAICADPQLSQADDLAARRVRTLAKRGGFGQYLGLRYWQNRVMDARIGCGGDRSCLRSSYRAQARALDRLQECLDGGSRKRECLRSTLSEDASALSDNAASAEGRRQPR